ncbi:uncharacterized protein [Macaca nemestrina]|uniref:uncharacterized protein isoform X3 n=2 Tax=Macaca nemestrina TaxID=9545 RepID=UPI0039B8D333
MIRTGRGCEGKTKYRGIGAWGLSFFIFGPQEGWQGWKQMEKCMRARPEPRQKGSADLARVQEGLCLLGFLSYCTTLGALGPVRWRHRLRARSRASPLTCELFSQRMLHGSSLLYPLFSSTSAKTIADCLGKGGRAQYHFPDTILDVREMAVNRTALEADKSKIKLVADAVSGQRHFVFIYCQILQSYSYTWYVFIYSFIQK